MWDENGARMPDVEVTIVRSHFQITDELTNSAMGNHRTTTRSDGRFTIEDVHQLAVADFGAQISASIDGSLATGRLPLPDGDATLALILHAVGTIEGTVVGAHIDEYDRPGVEVESTSDPRLHMFGSTELDGSFRIGNVPHGNYRVRLRDGNSAAIQVSVTAGIATNVTLKAVSQWGGRCLTRGARARRKEGAVGCGLWEG